MVAATALLEPRAAAAYPLSWGFVPSWGLRPALNTLVAVFLRLAPYLMGASAAGVVLVAPLFAASRFGLRPAREVWHWLAWLGVALAGGGLALAALLAAGFLLVLLLSLAVWVALAVLMIVAAACWVYVWSAW